MNNSRWLKKFLPLAIALALLLAIFAVTMHITAPALAEELAGESIPWWVVAGGGSGGANAGNVHLEGTIGQPVAGYSSDNNLVLLEAGYWNTDDPTAANLAGFQATSFAGTVTLTWQTLLEIDILGFDLYRCPQPISLPDESCTQLNPDMIPASVPGKLIGASYTYLDSGLLPGQFAYYWLEVVNRDGQQLYGPQQATGQYGVYLPLTMRNP
jgi:hypothetical protein